MIILDGKKCAADILKNLQESLATIDQPIGIAFILVGEDKASQIYVKMKQKACAQVGINSVLIELSDQISEKELIQAIEKQNSDPNIYGILVQQPLPAPIRVATIVSAIAPSKDVDGFHPLNLGKILSQDSTGFIPCTPLGITKLLKYYGISLNNKHVAIVGRSLIVGKPLATLLSQKTDFLNATVTLIHKTSHNKRSLLNSADVIIACAGVKHLIKAEDVKKEAIVIDVGIHREKHAGRYRITGDVDFESVKDKCYAISPVPGGVGPMTIACLLENTFSSFKKAHKLN
ncbi:bifunctional 5,10-methylene-tetrahydrofolate dehydrogenase/5,10-methylene-tetrahydrofolate cyclohydrolase [Candidatus Aerophobetes bacterium]|uniref:Bifunctional protein FolD n=1 Tax=Aerophobetes bacterium TaxID=2030807 RepID=A0A2A4X9L4_UNCAE|nr:MAG: bifunctional 5,10-methylene-tetrahydrofolate dehydrogenase/5,10-methylene-tetrahydrofolate cyclohydrolase [Candidatus Aerophobetes bacterium]